MAVVQLVPDEFLPMLSKYSPVPFDAVNPSHIPDTSFIVTYAGLVVAIENTNAIVWREGKPLVIAFASTVANETNDAWIDAPEAIQAEYKAYLIKGQRHERAAFLMYQRALMRKDRHAAGLSMAEHRKLCTLYIFKGQSYTSIIKLLSSKYFKSTFRRSCHSKVREWLATGDQWKHPLSSRELNFL